MLSNRTTRRNLWTASAAVGTLLAVGLSSPAAAQPEKCAQTIAKELRKDMKTGQKDQDKCHKLANKICVGSEGVCNDPDSVAFQIVDKNKYGNTVNKGLAKINETGGVCTAASAVLDQYPGDNVANMTFYFNDLLANRADDMLGSDDLECDEAAVTCFSTISKQRAAVADKMLNSAIKCMKNATPGSALDLNCLASAPIQGSLDKAALKINEDCSGIDGSDIGSCDPLPGCVVDGAVAEGQTAATRIYPAENCSPVTGVDGRTATVNLTTPTALGGLTVEIAYPQYVMGLPENGADVADDFTYSVDLLSPFDLDGVLRLQIIDFDGVSSGTLVTIPFDKCRDLALGSCDGNPSIACNNDVACGVDAPCNITNGVCSFSTFTNCSDDGDCPTGESCVAQGSVTTCAVVEASDTGGNPVAGATCSVTLTEP